MRIGKKKECADDQVILRKTEQLLLRSLDRLNKTAKLFDMKINVYNTKVMAIARILQALHLNIERSNIQVN